MACVRTVAMEGYRCILEVEGSTVFVNSENMGLKVEKVEGKSQGRLSYLCGGP